MALARVEINTGATHRGSPRGSDTRQLLALTAAGSTEVFSPGNAGGEAIGLDGDRQSRSSNHMLSF